MCVRVCGLQSLVTHDSHADSATFGPSRTSLSQPIADWIHTYIEIKNATAAPRSLYLFPSDSDASKPLSSTKWTRTVKAVWKRHSGVPLCPKVYAARRQGSCANDARYSSRTTPTHTSDRICAHPSSHGSSRGRIRTRRFALRRRRCGTPPRCRRAPRTTRRGATVSCPPPSPLRPPTLPPSFPAPHHAQR